MRMRSRRRSTRGKEEKRRAVEKDEMQADREATCGKWLEWSEEVLRRRLVKSGKGWLAMLDSRDPGRDSEEDEAKRRSSGSRSVVKRKRQVELAVRTNKLVHAMMIWSEVEMENGRWCMRLVNESQNHNEMTERAGNGAEVWKLVKDICRRGKKNLPANKASYEGKPHGESRGNGNSGETRFMSVTWKTSEKQHTKNRDVDRAASTSKLRWVRAPRQIEMITERSTASKEKEGSEWKREPRRRRRQ